MTRADEMAAQIEALSRELAGSIVPDEKTNGEFHDHADVKKMQTIVRNLKAI
jgi:hypothetical protein